MNEHVTAWLEAYYDGELHGQRRQRVEMHLASCAVCRAELEQHRALTALLAETPAPASLTPAETFVAQVRLQLRPRPTQPAWRRGLQVAWRWAPAGLVGAWAVAQAVFILAGAVLIALQLGLGGDVAASLLPAAPPPAWLTTLLQADVGLSDVARAVPSLLGEDGPLLWPVVFRLALPTLVGLLTGGWLAIWWAMQKRRGGLENGLH